MPLPDYKAAYHYQLTQWAKEKDIDFGEIKDSQLNEQQQKYATQYNLERIGKFIKVLQHAEKTTRESNSNLRFKNRSIDSLIQEAV
ncbi:MAG: hypothetical protein V3V78_04935 [Candidatus Woesearchaeota archaeon]